MPPMHPPPPPKPVMTPPPKSLDSSGHAEATAVGAFGEKSHVVWVNGKKDRLVTGSSMLIYGNMVCRPFVHVLLHLRRLKVHFCSSLRCRKCTILIKMWFSLMENGSA